MQDRPIVVAGAGSIGCYVGGLHAHAGRRVALLARPRVIAEIERFGLTLTSLEGSSWHVASQQIKLSDDPKVLTDAGMVVVTVKSADTADVADAIARYAPSDAVVVSLQNGIGNVPVLRERLPGRTVLAAMVPFNVVASGDGRFHRATSGDIVIEDGAAGAAARLSIPELPMRATANIAGVQWGKLIVNLNNAINALSGLPLREQLGRRDWRRLFADQIAEGLMAVRAEGIAPVSPTLAPLSVTPHLLRLPDALFRIALAPAMTACCLLTACHGRRVRHAAQRHLHRNSAELHSAVELGLADALDLGDLRAEGRGVRARLARVVLVHHGLP